MAILITMKEAPETHLQLAVISTKVLCAMPNNNRAFLIILDGFGNRETKDWNAIRAANMPFYQETFGKYPHAELTTHGEAVGLPKGIMGNSEVGHTTIGAGRIVYQDLTRISKSIETGEFFKNPVLRETIQAGKNKTGRVHLMGLVSDGGVHSTMEHLLALLDLCVREEVPNVSVHCFLDGRDTPPDSSINYVRQILEHPALKPNGQNKTHACIATIQGRYWAMDRDKRWERVTKGYQALTGQIPSSTDSPLEVIQKSHVDGKTDEFVEPVLLNSSAAMKTGDSVMFFNYRADRAREITAALSEPDFKEFDRGTGFTPSAYAGMTSYDKSFKHLKVAFGPQNLDNIFGQWLEKKGLKQFRIAETEKYAHVTFFFNGGREKPFEGEERVLIDSPKEVATYDLKPEMSAIPVAHELSQRLKSKKYDFVLVNFANPDMVGHTGNFDAAVKALEVLDKCLAEIVPIAQASGYEILITADHGNAEEMRDSNGKLHTQHTLNPVPIIWVSANPSHNRGKLHNGSLQDLMPTLCNLMNIPIPPESTGKTLINPI